VKVSVSTIVAVLVIVVAVTMVVMHAQSGRLGQSGQPAPVSSTQEQVREMTARGGIFSAKYFKQLPDLYLTGARRPITSRELRLIFLHLNEATAPPSTDRPMLVFCMLEDLDFAQLTPEQLSGAQKAALPLLSENDEVYPVGLIQERTCIFYKRHPYPPAVPQLLALLKSPHPLVGYEAALALVEAGYKVNVPPKPTGPIR